jgi:hypothetical protein
MKRDGRDKPPLIELALGRCFLLLLPVTVGPAACLGRSRGLFSLT